MILSFDADDILATGKDVIVIGGGDTGSDCVGTSNRQGANSVKQFELMVQPPTERTTNMPWPTYPMLLKNTSSHEEGADRFWGVNTEEFIGDEDGNLKALKIVDVSWEIDGMGPPDKICARRWLGTRNTLPACIFSYGFFKPPI